MKDWGVPILTFIAGLSIAIAGLLYMGQHQPLHLDPVWAYCRGFVDGWGTQDRRIQEYTMAPYTKEALKPFEDGCREAVEAGVWTGTIAGPLRIRTQEAEE